MLSLATAVFISLTQPEVSQVQRGSSSTGDQSSAVYALMISSLPAQRSGWDSTTWVPGF